MSCPHTRLVTFAGSSLTLTTNDPVFDPVIDLLFDSVAALPDGQPPAGYHLLADSGTFTLLKNDTQLYRGDSLPALADLLLGHGCHDLADRSCGGLLFHAGAVARNGRGVMFPGTMGAGKTTLTAWLLTYGFNYLSDELVFVPSGADSIEALPRPLNLKKPARPVLQPFLDFEAQADKITSTAFVDLVPPTLLNPETRFSRPPLSAIVFPTYQAGAAFQWVPLSKAQAGKALMECLVNARNLPGHGFDDIARLARRIPACRMTYSHFEQVGDRVEALFER